MIEKIEKKLKVECNKCKELINEDEVSLIDGDWVCNKCKEEFDI